MYIDIDTDYLYLYLYPCIYIYLYIFISFPSYFLSGGIDVLLVLSLINELYNIFSQEFIFHLHQSHVGHSLKSACEQCGMERSIRTTTGTLNGHRIARHLGRVHTPKARGESSLGTA